MVDRQALVDDLALARRTSELLATSALGPRELAAYDLGREHERARTDAAADEVMGIRTFLPPGVTPPDGIAPRAEDLGGGYHDETPVDRLRARLLDSAGLDHIPAPQPVVAGVLYRDSLAWLIGPPGHGKSFVALDIAGHVGTGETWAGNPTTAGRVLYVIAEGASGLRGRVRAWEDAMRQSMADVVFLPVAVQAAADGDWTALVELAAERPPALVVLDTQARVTVGMEENSARDMGLFVHRAERLRSATAGCVLVVHHQGRNGEHMRGSTALEGAATTIMRVSKDEDLVTVECAKQKDAAPFEPIYLRLVPHASTAVLTPTDHPHATVGDSPALRRALIAWWECHGSEWLSASTLIKSKVIAESTFHRNRKALVDSGRAEQRGERQMRQYRLPQAPDEG